MKTRYAVTAIFISIILCAAAQAENQLVIKTNHMYNMAATGEPLTVTITSENEQAYDGTLKTRVIDFYGETFQNESSNIEKGKPLSETITIAALPPGFYRVQTMLVSGGEKLKATASLAVLEPRTSNSHNSMYGINGCTNPELLNLAGIPWRRLDISWPGIEKEQGVFDFSRYDARVDPLAKGGINLLGILDYTPRWAAKIPDNYAEIPDGPHKGWGHFPPRDVNEWQNFVVKTIEHYRGKIKYWEIWNEPYPNSLFFNGGSVQDYIDILEATYARGKEICPECTFVGLGGTNSQHAKMVFASGGLNLMDIASIHTYQPGTAPEFGIFKSNIQETFAEMRENDKLIPLWLTESGWPTHKGMSDVWIASTEEDQARYLVRSFIIAKSEGIENFFWYTFSNGQPDPTNFERNQGIVYHDSTPKPSFVSFAVMTNQLGGLDLLQLKQFGKREYAALVANEGKYIFVVWTTGKKKALRVDMPELKKARFINMMGGPLDPANGSISISRSPVYIVIDKNVSEDALKNVF
ncbi:MAG TPA: hypothetical protein PLN69_06210 [bacterium]|nr:hypothetical protein [bacterium]